MTEKLKKGDVVWLNEKGLRHWNEETETGQPDYDRVLLADSMLRRFIVIDPLWETSTEDEHELGCDVQLADYESYNHETKQVSSIHDLFPFWADMLAVPDNSTSAAIDWVTKGE